MSRQGQEDYRKIAQDILDEERAAIADEQMKMNKKKTGRIFGKNASMYGDKNVDFDAKDVKAADVIGLDKAEALIADEEDMSDSGRAEALIAAINEIGPEAFFSMSAAELAENSPVQLSEEEAVIYDNASPEERMSMMEYIMESGGMESLLDRESDKVQGEDSEDARYE